MPLRYDRHKDQMTGLDLRGVAGNGMGRFVLDELELGAKVALALGDPEQAFWELEFNLRVREVQRV